MSDNVPICANCAFIVGFANWREPRCYRPIGTEFSPVRGTSSQLLDADCASERSTDVAFLSRRQRCGPSGRFFEPRPPMTPAWGGGGARDDDQVQV